MLFASSCVDMFHHVCVHGDVEIVNGCVGPGLVEVVEGGVGEAYVRVMVFAR